MQNALLIDVEAFLARHGVADSALGREALNDWAFVKDIRSGRRVWPETEAKVRKFMSEYRADLPTEGEAA